ncbi:MAG TPA: rod shape-determining protein MreC [Terracidiphilus sp.]|jgi:rod shape-determining protein MreC
MESFFARYRNVLVLLALLVAQIIGLAMQVRRTDSGRVSLDPTDSSGVRLIRLWANAIVSPPERAVQSSKTGVGSLWENYIDLRRVREQNKDLQSTIDRLRLEQAALLEDARQGQRLQAMMNFEQKYLYKTLPAQVIGTSGSDLSRVFYLDKGKNDGLARDMAVVTAEGIVGKVREVFPHSAQVLAINDESSGAGVILETTRTRGILRGNVDGQPQIVGILADQRIQPGEKVLTAGGDEIFPRGLPVGVVEKVVRDPDRDAFINVIVKPAAQLDRLDEVMVITATEPRFSPQQRQDLATSEALKGAEAAELAEKKKASEIMAERLPGLTDPNAPAAKPAEKGPNGAPVAPTTTIPKIIPPQHPDRFTPGNAEQPEGAAPSHTAPPKASELQAPANKPPEMKDAAPGSPDTHRPSPKPAKQPPPPTPQREP